MFLPPLFSVYRSLGPGFESPKIKSSMSIFISHLRHTYIHSMCRWEMYDNKSEAQCFPYQNHFALAHTVHLPQENLNAAADTLGMTAIVAAHFPAGAGRGQIIASGVHRAGNVPRPMDGFVQRGNDFVFADDEIHLFLAVSRGSQTVAVAVHIHQFAGFGSTVDAAKIDLRCSGTGKCLLPVLLPMPVDAVVLTQAVIQTKKRKP